MKFFIRILTVTILTCCSSTSFGATFARFARQAGTCAVVVFSARSFMVPHARCVDGDERGDAFRGKSLRALVASRQPSTQAVPRKSDGEFEACLHLLYAIQEHNPEKAKELLDGNAIRGSKEFLHPLMMAVRNLCEATQSTAADDLGIIRLLVTYKITVPGALKFLAEQKPTSTIRAGVLALLESRCVITDLELKTTTGKTVGEELFEKYGFDLYCHC